MLSTGLRLALPVVALLLLIDFALALQTLLDDFAVQHAKEAAAKTEAKPLTILCLITEAGVVEAQFAERLAQRLEVAVVHGIKPAEHHRLRFLVAG